MVLRGFNTIYSVKINYRGPKIGICSSPFNLAAARKEILPNHHPIFHNIAGATYVNYSK